MPRGPGRPAPDETHRCLFAGQEEWGRKSQATMLPLPKIEPGLGALLPASHEPVQGKPAAERTAMKLVKNEGGTWSVHVKGKNGKAHQFSTNTKEFAMAKRVVSEAKIKELEMAAEIGALTQEVVSVLLTGSRMTVEKAIEPWKTWMQMVNYAPRTIADGELRVRCWMKRANVTNKQLSAITEYDINPWVNETSKRKATTRRTTLALVRNFFDFCSRKGWLQGNPSRLCDVDLSKLSHEQKERRPTPTWTDEEVKRVLDYTDPDKEQMFVPTKENVPIASSDKLWYQPPNLLLHRNYYRRINQPNPFWHAAVALSRHTGLRLGDCCCLEWASLVTPGEITVWTIKRDRRINVPIPDEVVRALAHIPPEDPTYVFP